jgi:hypothetical protein
LTSQKRILPKVKLSVALIAVQTQRLRHGDGHHISAFPSHLSCSYNFKNGSELESDHHYRSFAVTVVVIVQRWQINVKNSVGRQLSVGSGKKL